MKKYLTFITFFVIIVGSGSLAFSQIRIAYVNSEKILTDYPEAQKAQKEFEGEVKPWQDEFDKMRSEYQKGVEEYQKKESLMQQAAKDAKVKELGDLEKKIRDYYTQKLDPRQGEAASLREKKFAPIREKVLKTIEAVAKEEGFSFVFDKIGDAVLLYGDTKYDLTYKVLDRLKRGTSSSSKSK